MATTVSSDNTLFDEFRLPAQDLLRLSFCAPKAQHVKEWVESLHATRIGQTSVILYKTLPEVVRLKTSVEQRLSMLETMRPFVNQCIEGLTREFLHQPLILPEQQMKTAIIAQALQKYLNDGYMVVTRDLCLSRKKNTVKQQELATAIYRAVAGIGQLLLRSYQLYIPRLPEFWRQLHQLYQLAQELEVAKQSITDTQLKTRKAMSITHAYTRILMLDCSTPNQLRQTDITQLYQALEEWSTMVTLETTDPSNEHTLYWVDLLSDKGPFYKQRFRGEPGEHIKEINTNALLFMLNEEAPEDNTPPIETNQQPLRQSLLTHAIQSWQQLKRRQEDRQSAHQILETCAGLSAIHEQLLGKVSFETFLKSPGDNQETPSFGDFAMPLVDVEEEDDDDQKPKICINQISSATAIDSSGSGFCLKWENQIPSHVKVGELVGLREPQRHRWHIGIVRWVQRHQSSTYVGVQLLGKKATPYAASTTLPDGTNSPYFRALLLTDSPHSSSTYSLVTPSVPFEVNQKIRLRQNGEQTRAHLTRRLIASGAISQFTYREIKQAKQPTSSE